MHRHKPSEILKQCAKFQVRKFYAMYKELQFMHMVTEAMCSHNTAHCLNITPDPQRTVCQELLKMDIFHMPNTLTNST